jgi:hypothetical protein
VIWGAVPVSMTPCQIEMRPLVPDEGEVLEADGA